MAKTSSLATSRIGDGGEVEPADRAGHLNRQPDHLGEVPHVVVEYRPGSALGQDEPCFTADAGAGEDRPLRICDAERDYAHPVASSGRRGSSSSWSPTRWSA